MCVISTSDVELSSKLQHLWPGKEKHKWCTYTLVLNYLNNQLVDRCVIIIAHNHE